MSLPAGYREAYIGLGSNLEDSVAHVTQARVEIAALAEVIELGFSALYRSLPVGPQDQPDYVNAAMRIATALPAIDLLRRLQAIENRHGRVRGQRWGARTLDLDLLLYDSQIIEQPDLIVPHPELAKRAFVLYPLAELSLPDLMVPGLGSLSELMTHCRPDGLTRIVS